MNPTQDTLDLVKGALRSPDDRISKTISTGTGLVAFDLQAPAKNLYPFVTPIRNVIPRVGGGTGTATNWRQVTALVGSGYDAMGWVPEGQRSAQCRTRPPPNRRRLSRSARKTRPPTKRSALVADSKTSSRG